MTSPIRQKTLKNLIRAAGIGLHSGERAVMTLRPADPDTGVVFVRTDLSPNVEIAANVQNVGDTLLATTLVKGETTIATVEHLMSALAGVGVDNVRVEVNAAELPIMDGSSSPFVFLLQSAGLAEQAALRRFLRIRRTVSIREDDVAASLSSHDGFRLDYTLVYDHPVLKCHTAQARVEFSPTVYVREVARARTFGFLTDYERLRSMNLARGGSLNNAVVIDDSSILNEEGLRLEDEFVKHKILDAIGDLYLVGAPIIGAFQGIKSGHRINNRLLRRLLEHPDAWEWVTFEDASALPERFHVRSVVAE
jgi:UDP-3-O-[3-hydroxymyristoyl] N-acetylglucosamine deacetylase